MAGFDHPGLVTADRFFEDDQGLPANELVDLKAKFKEFIRTYYNKAEKFKYRERLLDNFRSDKLQLSVNIRKVQAFDEKLAEDLIKKPGAYIPFFEDAAKEVVCELTKVGGDAGSVEDVESIQIMLYYKDKNAQPDLSSQRYNTRAANSIRSLSSSQVSKIVYVNGIIVAASQVKCKATAITLQCRSCRHTVADIPIKPGLDGYALPRRCGADQAGQAQKCPMDPYYILPDKCRCVDFQTLKLQETPEDVPQGELPRHLQLYCDRYLTDQVAPGNRVSICGVYSIRKIMKTGKGGGDKKGAVGTRGSYLRVLGIRRMDENSDPFASANPEERFTEDAFRDFAKKGHPFVLNMLSKSIAPSIYGSEDIKKAIACLLFGGSKKRLPDGLTRRGDLNVLLLGDPGTAKSQLLKFVEKAAPIGVYTSGKGSSAAGLTASVIRDPSTRSFIMEGGAMVLADMGVVCIDEFDKMREDDRVAIHEAMEQQTISIAKAGITTTLNSRCSVLAAANSVYGRWDDTKGEENIDFMPTILSRFDMIFIVKDEHNEARDRILAKHVIQVHISGNQGREAAVQPKDEKSMEFLKRYVKYCRAHCGPRLSDDAGRKLMNHYVKLRNPVDPQDKGVGTRKSAIPITVRQLEAVVRISESLAKMELKPVVSEQHVDEALRLFQVSTIEAASSGNLAGIEGFTTEEDHEMLSRVEKQMKKRFAIGTQVSEHVIIQDFVRQNYKEAIVRKVLISLIRRGDIQHRMQRKMLFRMK